MVQKDAEQENEMRTEVQEMKKEQSSISMMDDFARYARLERKISKMTDKLKTHGKRQQWLVPTSCTYIQNRANGTWTHDCPPKHQHASFYRVQLSVKLRLSPMGRFTTELIRKEIFFLQSFVIINALVIFLCLNFQFSLWDNTHTCWYTHCYS